MTATKPNHSYPLFGAAIIVLFCVVMELIYEHEEKANHYKLLHLNLSVQNTALTNYFQEIEIELQSAATSPNIISATEVLGDSWRQLNTEERSTIHDLFQAHRFSTKVKQAYIAGKESRDKQKYLSYTSRHHVDGGYLPAQLSTYDTAAHLRTTIRPELQKYLDYYTKIQKYGKQVVSHFGYYDLYLISNDGDVLYSHNLKDDYATNLISGPYRETGLGSVFSAALKNQNIAFSHFEPYSPSQNEQSMFSAYPITINGKVVGVIALQMSTQVMDKILGANGRSTDKSKTFLINEDYRLINPDAMDKVSLVNVANQPTVDNVIQGASVKRDSLSNNGNHYLVSYLPFKSHNINWAMRAQLNSAVVVTPIRLWWFTIAMSAMLVFLFFSWIIVRYLHRKNQRATI